MVIYILYTKYYRFIFITNENIQNFTDTKRGINVVLVHIMMNLPKKTEINYILWIFAN